MYYNYVCVCMCVRTGSGSYGYSSQLVPVKVGSHKVTTLVSCSDSSFAMTGILGIAMLYYRAQSCMVSVFIRPGGSLGMGE